MEGGPTPEGGGPAAGEEQADEVCVTGGSNTPEEEVFKERNASKRSSITAFRKGTMTLPVLTFLTVKSAVIFTSGRNHKATRVVSH